jgi:hypothetical protein
VDAHGRQLADELMDWLHRRGWRRAPYGMVLRLVTLVDEEDVLYWDATTSGDARAYEAQVVLFTEQRVFVQQVRHERGGAVADLGITVVRRSSLRHVTSTAVEPTPYGCLERLCDTLWDGGWHRVAGWLEARFGWCAQRSLTFQRWYSLTSADDPQDVSAVATYADLAEPLRLPMYVDLTGNDSRHDFAHFVTSLVADVR